jgi:hypothetical protein
VNTSGVCTVEPLSKPCFSRRSNPGAELVSMGADWAMTS